jgi:hypothetical protein
MFARAALRDCEAAQAVELVRALRHQLHEMTTQLARVERQDVTGRKGRAVRMEAAELRRDLKEAQALIDQLQRRYLNGDERTQRTSSASNPNTADSPSSQGTIKSRAGAVAPQYPARPGGGVART